MENKITPRQIAKFRAAEKCSLNENDRLLISQSENWFNDSEYWVSTLYNEVFDTLEDLANYICDDFAISRESLEVEYCITH